MSFQKIPQADRVLDTLDQLYRLSVESHHVPQHAVEGRPHEVSPLRKQPVQRTALVFQARGADTAR